jgi:hypothetical protein
MLALTKADISAVYQQTILDNLAEIWYVGKNIGHRCDFELSDCCSRLIFRGLFLS